MEWPPSGNTFPMLDGSPLSVDSDGKSIIVIVPWIPPSGLGYSVGVKQLGLAGSTPAVVPTPFYMAEVQRTGSLGSSPTRVISTRSAIDGVLGSPPGLLFVWEELDATGDGNILGALTVTQSDPGAALCFAHSGCPCSNSGPPPFAAGCLNSSGLGARLEGSGTNSVSAADLVLQVSDALPGQPGLFFQANLGLIGWLGLSFGNGLRCCGGSVLRLQVRFADASGAVSTSVNLPTVGGVQPGDARCYQYWYRDSNAVSPCTAGFNLTNAYDVIWTY